MAYVIKRHNKRRRCGLKKLALAVALLGILIAGQAYASYGFGLAEMGMGKASISLDAYHPELTPQSELNAVLFPAQGPASAYAIAPTANRTTKSQFDRGYIAVAGARSGILGVQTLMMLHGKDCVGFDASSPTNPTTLLVLLNGTDVSNLQLALDKVGWQGALRKGA